ncbi:unnamed protein product, partial [Staurois parvus]
SDIGSSGWTADIGSPGISRHRVIWRWIVWLDSGHRITRHDRGALSHQALDCLARQRASGHQYMTAGTGSPGIRSFGSPAGTHVIWQGSGHQVTRHDSGL